MKEKIRRRLRSYVVQFIIDLIVIMIGVTLSLIPTFANVNPNQLFYTTMGIYAFLEICEYFFDRTRKEPLFVATSTLTAVFSGLFLKAYDPSYVLPITIAVWMLMYAIIKFIALEEINPKKTHLFTIRLVCMSVLVLIGILICINIFYKVATISYMLSLLYLTYGGVELFCDFITFSANYSKFLKE